MSEPAREPTLPPGYSTVTPWIISPDSAALVRFLEAAFDASEIEGSRMLNQDGSIAHVEVKIGRSIVMLFDSYEGWPETPAFFRLYLGDADLAYQQALAAGASPITRVTELFWGDRVGRMRDPFGNIWWLQSHATDVPEHELQARTQDPAMLGGDALRAAIAGRRAPQSAQPAGLKPAGFGERARGSAAEELAAVLLAGARRRGP